MHGKFLVHPFVDRKIPIICDGSLVDMNFGTGAVKVTPAHDPNDFLCGRRHKLAEITGQSAINMRGHAVQIVRMSLFVSMHQVEFA